MKLFRKQTSPTMKKGFRERIHSISTREIWILCICIFVLLNIVSVIFSIFFFFTVTHLPKEATVPQVAVVETIDRAKLNDITLRFKQRVLEFEQRKTTPPAFPDPSR